MRHIWENLKARKPQILPPSPAPMIAMSTTSRRASSLEVELSSEDLFSLREIRLELKRAGVRLTQQSVDVVTRLEKLR